MGGRGRGDTGLLTQSSARVSMSGVGVRRGLPLYGVGVAVIIVGVDTDLSTVARIVVIGAGALLTLAGWLMKQRWTRGSLNPLDWQFTPGEPHGHQALDEAGSPRLGPARHVACGEPRQSVTRQVSRRTELSTQGRRSLCPRDPPLSEIQPAEPRG